MQKQNESNILTKECIVTALLRLMQDKPYDSISITEITSLAGVSRMAYYRNYKSKDEILLKHIEDEEQKFIQNVGYEKVDSIKTIITYISSFFQENVDVIKAIYSAGLSHLLSNMLSQRIYNYFPVAQETSSGRYAVHFYVAAIFSVFRLWFDEGMKQSAEEISEMIYNFVNMESAIDYLVIPEMK